MRNTIKTAAFLLLASIIALPAAAPLQSQQKNKVRLEYNINVSYKLVQVYVTDKSGKPVGDLNQADFVVTDNGRPVQLTEFEKHFDQTQATAPARTEEAVPADTPVVKRTVNRKFFLFFDFAFSDPRGLAKAKTAALKFIDSELLPTDEIGILSYSAMRGLILHEYLTTEHARIKQVIEGFGRRNALGRAENLADYYMVTAIRDDAGEAPSGDQFMDKLSRMQAASNASYVDQNRQTGYLGQAEFFLQSMYNLARVMRSVPGYKNIILFSGGIARQLLFGQANATVNFNSQNAFQIAADMRKYDATRPDIGLRNDFSSLMKELKASGCPVYAFDTSSLRTDSDVDSQEGMFSSVGLEGQDCLKQMAAESGGRFFAKTADFGTAIEDIKASTRNYYVLGFAVDDKWDGSFHKIKVRTNRKGLDVFTQGGYFSSKPFYQFTGLEKMIQLIDVALNENPEFGAPVDIPVAAAVVAAGGGTQVVTYARASSDQLREVLTGRSEIYFLAFDRGGNVVAIKKFNSGASTVGPSAVNAPVGPGILIPSLAALVKPGDYRCSLVIRNLDTGKCARGSLFLNVPAGPMPLASADRPILLARESGAREITAAAAQTMASIFGYGDGYYSPLAGVVPADTAKLYAALRPGQGLTAGNVEIKALLTAEGAGSGTEVPVAILNAANVDGGTGTAFLVELTPGSAPAPGRYVIKFTAGPKGGTPVYACSAAITVARAEEEK